MNTQYKNLILIAGGTLLVGLFLGWLIFGSTGEGKSEATHSHELAAEAPTVWTCSMHPQIRQSEPGKCPICGMDLIPLESESASIDPNAISMSAAAMQLANIRTQVVERAKPLKTVRLNGKIQADERLIFSQSAHLPGRIEQLMVNFTGEYIQKGQVVAKVYSPELVVAQEELFEAQKMQETQPQLLTSAKEKLKNWKMTDRQIEQILQSGTPQETFSITADVSGYVTEKRVNLGDYIGRGQPIYEVADLSRVWVLFDVYETDIPWIKKNDQVEFTVQSIPGEAFSGNISFLDPVINPNTRVAQARVEMRNNGMKMKPEMFASGTVEAKLPVKTDAIIIPKTAVMWTGKRSVVYIKSMSETGVSFVMQPVVLGPSLGESYIIESGLEAGNEIAVNGTFSIDAAAQLAGKPSMMNPEGAKPVTGHNHGTDMTSGKKDEAMAPKTANKISPEASKALQPLLNAYLKTRDGLIADDANIAKEGGEDMQKALAGVNMGMFIGESHENWMKYQGELSQGLTQFSQATTIGGMRKAFHAISETMIVLSNDFHPFKSAVYVIYCPMAEDNKGGNWLSLTPEVKNPYFGSSMLTCGAVQSTIK